MKVGMDSARADLRDRAEKISVGNGSANHADLVEDAKEMALAVLDLLKEADAVRDRDRKAIHMTTMMVAWKSGRLTGFSTTFFARSSVTP